MNNCQHLEDFLAYERLQLDRAITEHKWYLSERAGYDVGYQAAEQSFAENYLLEFAYAFRAKYCEQCQSPTRCGALNLASQAA
jgi:hypothetical protein